MGEGKEDVFVLVWAGLSSSVGSASHLTAKACRVSLAFALYSDKKAEHLLIVALSKSPAVRLFKSLQFL